MALLFKKNTSYPFNLQPLFYVCLPMAFVSATWFVPDALS